MNVVPALRTLLRIQTSLVGLLDLSIRHPDRNPRIVLERLQVDTLLLATWVADRLQETPLPPFVRKPR